MKKKKDKTSSSSKEKKSKRITYKKSNPLKSLLKTSGKVPNVQVKQGENVNLWK